MSTLMRASEAAQPTYAASTAFALAIPVRKGIYKRLQFDWRGTTVGSTAVNMDAITYGDPIRVRDTLANRPHFSAAVLQLTGMETESAPR